MDPCKFYLRRIEPCQSEWLCLRNTEYVLLSLNMLPFDKNSLYALKTTAATLVLFSREYRFKSQSSYPGVLQVVFGASSVITNVLDTPYLSSQLYLGQCLIAVLIYCHIGIIGSRKNLNKKRILWADISADMLNVTSKE